MQTLPDQRNLQVKFSFNSVTRIVTLSRPPSIVALATLAKDRFELTAEPIAFTYIDEDGDTITVSTDQEVQELAEANFEMIKLDIGLVQDGAHSISPTPVQDGVRDTQLLDSIKKALMDNPSLVGPIDELVTRARLEQARQNGGWHRSWKHQRQGHVICESDSSSNSQTSSDSDNEDDPSPITGKGEGEGQNRHEHKKRKLIKASDGYIAELGGLEADGKHSRGPPHHRRGHTDSTLPDPPRNGPREHHGRHSMFCPPPPPSPGPPPDWMRGQGHHGVMYPGPPPPPRSRHAHDNDVFNHGYDHPHIPRRMNTWPRHHHFFGNPHGFLASDLHPEHPFPPRMFGHRRQEGRRRDEGR